MRLAAIATVNDILLWYGLPALEDEKDIDDGVIVEKQLEEELANIAKGNVSSLGLLSSRIAGERLISPVPHKNSICRLLENPHVLCNKLTFRALD